MAKISIKDPSVRIKPSEQLCSFIASLTDYNEMPENILKIYQIYSGDVSTTKKTISNKDIPKPNLTGNDINLLKKLNANEIGQDIKTALDALFDSDDDAEKDDDDNDENNIENLDSAKPLSKSQAKKLKEKQKLRTKSRLTINLNDLKWLNNVLIEKRKTNQFNVYLHELMVESKLILPKNEIQIRNPELEARCVRLRLEQDARMYNAMTKNVDSSRKQMPEDTVAYQSHYLLLFLDSLGFILFFFLFYSETDQPTTNCSCPISIFCSRWFCFWFYWR